MAHYAFLDHNNIVTEVIVGRDENDPPGNWEAYYGNIRKQKCVRTSYTGSIRGKFAGIGDYYDEFTNTFQSVSATQG